MGAPPAAARFRAANPLSLAGIRHDRTSHRRVHPDPSIGTLKEYAMSAMTEGEHRYNQLIKIFRSAPEPAFESEAQQQAVWGRAWGCSNDVGRLRMVLMHRPGEELNVIDPTKRIPGVGAFGDPEQGWYWRGDVIPDFEAMRRQHDGLVQALREEDVEVVMLDGIAPGRMKSVF